MQDDAVDVDLHHVRRTPDPGQHRDRGGRAPSHVDRADDRRGVLQQWHRTPAVDDVAGPVLDPQQSDVAGAVPVRDDSDALTVRRDPERHDGTSLESRSRDLYGMVGIDPPDLPRRRHRPQPPSRLNWGRSRPSRASTDLVPWPSTVPLMICLPTRRAASTPSVPTATALASHAWVPKSPLTTRA